MANSLAYCELYVVLGTLFRRFDNIKGNRLSPDDLVYDDYLSAYPPMTATRFHIRAGETAVS
jgi:hypothetical protein